MASPWQIEAGHLVQRWSDTGQRRPYNAPWMEEVSAAQSSYLSPVPDFAGHSPFGGPAWFDRYTRRDDRHASRTTGNFHSLALSSSIHLDPQG
jgi:hypothetical protein